MITMILDNNIENIRIYDAAGVGRIFIDLEVLGKKERQGHLDTVMSNHSIDDIGFVRKVLKHAELLTRINPLHEGSVQEIESVVEKGTDIIMLPMFKTVSEVAAFVSCVNGRARTCLLLETAEALCRIDDILEVDGIDEIHIGLNDLSLSMGLDFMFELLSGGVVEYLAGKIKSKGIPFGVGGVACMDEGMLAGAVVMREHVRIGSSMVILSRTFKNDLQVDGDLFEKEIAKLHEVVCSAGTASTEELLKNKTILMESVGDVAHILRSKHV